MMPWKSYQHLPETPLTRLHLLYIDIIPFWNQDDPRSENLTFSFCAKGPMSPPQESHVIVIRKQGSTSAGR